MVAEVVHGAPYRFADPARFSFAHGGKDGHPFPVPLRVYDETIRVLKSAVQKAKLGRERGTRCTEAARRPGAAAGASRPRVPGFDDLIAQERAAFARVRRPQRLRLGASQVSGKIGIVKQQS